MIIKTVQSLERKDRKREQAQNSENTKRQTSFPEEMVENADLPKPILKKIMTPYEKCVKYNFVAPLTKVV